MTEDLDVGDRGRHIVFYRLPGSFLHFLFGRGADRDYYGAGTGRGRGVAAAVLDFHEAAVVAEVLPVAARLITVQELEGMPVAGKGAEAEGGGGGVVEGCILTHEAFRNFFLGLVDFMVQKGLFHEGEARGAPTGDDHVVDERVFEGGLGLEFVAERLGELVEMGFGFPSEEDSFGEDAVFNGVLRGIDFAGGRGRSAGFGAVGTGRLELRFGSHDQGVARLKAYLRAWSGEFVEFKGNRDRARW